MRYLVTSRHLPAEEVRERCLAAGARHLRLAPLLRQVSCELTEAGAAELSASPGIIIRPTQQVTTDQWRTFPDISRDTEALQPVYAASQGSLFTMLYDLRNSVSPPVLGNNVTIIIIDTGVRSSHIGLRGKVILEENFTSSGTVADVFDHGTGVAYLLGGGIHEHGQECGVAPGVKFISLKALNDDGTGTDEDVIMALNRALELWQAAEDAGMYHTAEMYPNGINMSFGAEDDGDPDNPIRVAIEEIWRRAGNRLVMYAAAGNAGPAPGTIMLPAAVEEVRAVGAATFQPFEVWERSSRGPTALGAVKPDMIFVGVQILTASSASDTSFDVKSGTSFSCPVGLGLVSLLGEYSTRAGFDQQLLEMDRAGWDVFTGIMSRKPDGAPATRDNACGLGMPMGDLAIRALGLTPAVDIGALLGPMALAAMMPVMMRGI